LEQARPAEREGTDSLAEWAGLAQQALILQRMGRREESEKIAGEYPRRVGPWPTRSKVLLNQLEGELALARGDATRAVAVLSEAEPTLSARGPASPTPPHVRLWYALASAHLAAGDEEKAAQYFQRVVESTTEHVRHPIPYVRSFYFLGKLHEKRGESEKAREYYRRFVDFWKDGDLDRDRVAEAQSKIGI
jgi:tetratricopeptide (TPR) repeat protein